MTNSFSSPLHQDVPETASFPVVLHHLEDLEMAVEERDDFRLGEAPAIGALGDVPGSLFAPEVAELGTEDGEDVVAPRLEDTQQPGKIRRPVGFALVVQTSPVEDDVEGRTPERQRQDVGPAEANSLRLALRGEVPRTLEGQRLGIDAENIEAETACGDAVPAFAAAEVEQPARLDAPPHAPQRGDRPGARLFGLPAVHSGAVGLTEVLSIHISCQRHIPSAAGPPEC